MGRSAMTLAVTGMLVQADKMYVIGNNIANSRTVGFKANKMNFKEEFVSHAGQFLNGTQNQYGNGVAAAGITTDWGSGSIESTGNSANVAVAGEGFFVVNYQSNTYYTRSGDFSVVEDSANPGTYVFMRPNGDILQGGASDGTNVTIAGNVSFNGAPTSIEISPSGTVSCLPTTVTVTNNIIGLQRFNNPDSLQREEGGLYKTTSLTSKMSTNPFEPGAGGSGSMVQGSLENSNVDLVTEFTDMMVTQRAFQANSKTVTTSDEMLQVVLSLKR